MIWMPVSLGSFRHFCEVGFIFLPVQFLFAKVGEQCYTAIRQLPDRGYKEP
jgi:hypothetical protein